MPNDNKLLPPTGTGTADIRVATRTVTYSGDASDVQAVGIAVFAGSDDADAIDLSPYDSARKGILAYSHPSVDSELVVPRDGLYRISAQVYFQSANTAFDVRLVRSGSGSEGASFPSGAAWGNYTVVRYMQQGDIVVLKVWQNSGSNRTFVVRNFTIEYLGRVA